MSSPAIPQLLSLKLDDVYDELYKGDREVKRYCPQCGHKTLRKGSRWSGGGQHRFWACTHNMQPRSFRGKSHDRKACDLVLAFNDRDADIDDYGGVLGLLGQIHIPKIKQWLLKHDDEIHARGMVVIYEGPIFDIVRRRNSSGVAAALYWRARTHEDEDEDMFHPDKPIFDFARSEAAQYVSYKGFSAAHLFQRGKYFNIWQPDDEEAIFDGVTCGKRMQAKIIEWAKAFEADIPKILMEAKAEAKRWEDEEKAFKRALWDHVGDRNINSMSMQHYNGETRHASFWLGCVSPAAAIEVRDLLQQDIPFSGLTCANRSGLTLEEACKVEDLLGIKYSVPLNKFSYSLKLNVDMAKDLAAIVHRGAR